MYVETKRTSKGHVVRYVFDTIEEYKILMDNLDAIAKSEIFKNKEENLKSIIDLFHDYYDKSNKYCDGKPAVTIFENHIFKIGALLFDFEMLAYGWTTKYMSLLEDYIDLQDRVATLMEKEIKNHET